jgi:hypothetical protein
VRLPRRLSAVGGGGAAAASCHSQLHRAARSWRELMTRLQMDSKIAVKRAERELAGSVTLAAVEHKMFASERRPQTNVVVARVSAAAIDAAGQVYVFGTGVTPGCVSLLGAVAVAAAARWLSVGPGGLSPMAARSRVTQ